MTSTLQKVRVSGSFSRSLWRAKVHAWIKLVSGAVVLCQQSCGLRLGRRCAAALLVQGSAHVYSKKVEYLHQLVLQSLDAVDDKK